MLIHTGTSPASARLNIRTEPPFVDPLYLENAVQRFPQTTFVLCNAGYDYASERLKWLDSCLTLMETYPNVRMSLNGIGSGPDFQDNSGNTTKTLATLFDTLKRRELLSKTMYGEALALARRCKLCVVPRLRSH